MNDLSKKLSLPLKNINSYKNITLKYVDNIYENRLSLLNRSLKEDIKYLMEREISSPEIELVIIEQDNNFYQKQAMKFAQKYKKQYIIERNMWK